MTEMDNNTFGQRLGSIFKSKFLRSVFLRIISIFLIVIIGVIAIVFSSFTSEINKRIISERQKQLDVIENTISTRMEEISSISYNIGKNKTFYLEPVSGEKYSGYEMAATLDNYLVGNGFIEHLAYYRLSEPNTIYTSNGELSFSDFWGAYLGLDNVTAELITQRIRSATEIQVNPISFGDDGRKFFSYLYPLPEFSKEPQAFVLMLIPFSEVEPILEAQISDCCGQISVFDSSGREVYCKSNLDESVTQSLPELLEEETGELFSFGGKKYIIQKKVSPSNGWTYVSVIRMNDIISEAAGKQLVSILLLLALMLVAIFTMLMCILRQYKPINELAVTLTDGEGDGNAVIDEESLLSDTLVKLKGDSELKKRFEEAYHSA